MDSFDLNTRLPPRKRLLAGLKKEGSDCDFSLPVPLISSDLSARIHDIINSTTSSPDEIIEATKSVALAATEVAAAARATAMEKAAAAVKARTAAKNALELLDSISRSEAARKDCPTKTKSRKKHVAVKLLYGNKQPVGNRETDEELARRLHRAMNSSPRISKSKQKKLHGSGKEEVQNGGAACSGNSPVSDAKAVQLNNGYSIDKLEEKIVVCSKDDLFETEEEESGCHLEKYHHGSKERIIAGCRKAKIKRKKLPLSQCNVRDQGETEETQRSVDHALTRESELDHVERYTSSDNAKHSDDGHLSMKITSTWKCKKLKVSQCSSDSKIMHALCSNRAPAKASAMVKVD
ncbi:uncharacterized protein [Elaeis guineensis]|uniref:Uncharacterized protein LOC105055241 n=1 Tax=Elaeis guineensis var. tenera TaxID=51953 RepID=A0A6I9RZR5_ELAGV|nr:uncharacterized protein LOC105055241 [Elaeis guineensis]XP_010935313.1 uncharacterized protein LOC105055241 [Elaeis guineensis]